MKIGAAGAFYNVQDGRSEIIRAQAYVSLCDQSVLHVFGQPVMSR